MKDHHTLNKPWKPQRRTQRPITVRTWWTSSKTGASSSQSQASPSKNVVPTVLPAGGGPDRRCHGPGRGTPRGRAWRGPNWMSGTVERNSAGIETIINRILGANSDVGFDKGANLDNGSRNSFEILNNYGWWREIS
ncbi:hypothetical protein QJS04_geneDACA013537 [Acorus gramineus]|uniref:Uncharacterized protein n=1 Tax=Acorus gramineus TaxID=55184 RepID=A0AAV9AKF4_ACOGR|nr:hypothetical protein QJS04_geneDACA013537 [Acorus gramineus]